MSSDMTIKYLLIGGSGFIGSHLARALVDSGKRFAATVEDPTGDGNSEAPVGTTVALMEKGQRVMSAIHKRLHYAQRCEFKILKRV